MWPLTLTAQRAAAHVLGQDGPVALQLPDNALVDGDVISAAADTAAEIHLHRAGVPTCAEPSVASTSGPWEGTAKSPRSAGCSD